MSAVAGFAAGAGTEGTGIVGTAMVGVGNVPTVKGTVGVTETLVTTGTDGTEVVGIATVGIVLVVVVETGVVTATGVLVVVLGEVLGTETVGIVAPQVAVTGQASCAEELAAKQTDAIVASANAVNIRLIMGVTPVWVGDRLRAGRERAASKGSDISYCYRISV